MLSNFSESGTSNRFISKLTIWHANSLFMILLSFYSWNLAVINFMKVFFNCGIYVEENNVPLDKLILKYCLTFDMWENSL